MHRLSCLAVLGWLALALLPRTLSAQPAAADAVPAVASEPQPASPASEAAPPQPAGSPAAAAGGTTAEPTAAAEPPPAPLPPPPPTLLVNINLTTQRMVVTENGVQKYTWAISSGAYGYPTPVGTFKPTWMTKMWYSKQYDNAPMPHAIFFQRGAAIHATSSIHLLGTPASHGCVRLAPSNAARLYGMVARHGKDRTEITVHGRPKYTAPRVARMQPAPPRLRYAPSTYRYAGYDGYQLYAPPPRYVYPGGAPPRYYMRLNKQRAAALKKRRTAIREYYSPY